MSEAQPETNTDTRHGRRLLAIWVVASAIATPLVYFVWGPHMPPGDMSNSANGQQFDNTVLGAMATPVFLAVVIYFAYAIVVWRHRGDFDDERDGPPIRGNVRVQASWIAVTSAIVLAVFGFGFYELAAPAAAGAGSGEGPAPIWKPGSAPLVVQVIAQQWRFSYRYPQFGGFETADLAIPQGQPVQFDVTSLDVIHSFWAYQLGVKADANPGVNDIAYTTAEHTGTFTVRCAELCGLGHGDMTDTGTVMTSGAFQQWASSSETSLAALTRALPPFATVYSPNIIPTLGKELTENGINGANGGYYPPQDPVQP